MVLKTVEMDRAVILRHGIIIFVIEGWEEVYIVYKSIDTHWSLSELDESDILESQCNYLPGYLYWKYEIIITQLHNIKINIIVKLFEYQCNLIHLKLYKVTIKEVYRGKFTGKKQGKQLSC